MPPESGCRFAFVFVCQSGAPDVNALLLAASLRRFLRCRYELIAAIPPPNNLSGPPDERAIGLLAKLKARPVAIGNELEASCSSGHKISCLKIRADADKLIFLESDMIALQEFHEQERFKAYPFNAKPADFQKADCDEEAWRRLYAGAGVRLPSMQFPATTSREFGLPFFDTGFIAVDQGIQFGEAWLECCRQVLISELSNKQRLEEVGLPLAVARLGLSIDCLDEGYNYPAHLKPLDRRRLPFFCHYRSPDLFLREPTLCDLLQSLLREHPDLADILEKDPEWSEPYRIANGAAGPGRAVSSPVVCAGARSVAQQRSSLEANLIITGISRSGTSYLCNLLHRFSNCVIVNEPAEVFEPLMRERVPWGIARLYAQIRSDVWNGKTIQNKLRAEQVTEDTMVANERSAYKPQVQDENFVLGTKNTHAYRSRLSALRRVLPEARIVVCVRDPFATIASWKTSFPHLREAKVDKMRVGNPRDPWLTARQVAALELIVATKDLAQRRAMWWNYMAEDILEQGQTVVLVRYSDLVTTPEIVVNRILEGFSAGSLLEPIEPSAVRSKRSELDAADEQAIRAICSQTAAELGL